MLWSVATDATVHIKATTIRSISIAFEIWPGSTRPQVRSGSSGEDWTEWSPTKTTKILPVVVRNIPHWNDNMSASCSLWLQEAKERRAKGTVESLEWQTKMCNRRRPHRGGTKKKKRWVPETKPQSFIPGKQILAHPVRCRPYFPHRCVCVFTRVSSLCVRPASGRHLCCTKAGGCVCLCLWRAAITAILSVMECVCMCVYSSPAPADRCVFITSGKMLTVCNKLMELTLHEGPIFTHKHSHWS